VAKLPNGLRLVVIEQSFGRLGGAELVVPGGMAGFASEAPAVFQLMDDCSLAGTTTRTETQVFEAMNSLLAVIQSTVDDDWFSYRVRAPSNHFDQAFELFRDVALHPAFDGALVELKRRRHVAAAPQSAEDPSMLALRALGAAIYGREHPYARSLAPMNMAVPTLTREEVLRAWKTAVDPADATLIVVSDMDTETVKVRAQGLFGAWKHDPARTPPATVPGPLPPSASRARLIGVDRPGATQTTIAYGTAIHSVSSPMRAAEAVVTQLLGAMPSSTTERRLRDELGASVYGTAYMRVRRGAGLSWSQASVAREKTVEALRALEQRVRELHDRGPTLEELTSAKGRLSQSFPRMFETTGGMLDAYARLAAYGQPLDELKTWPALIDEVSVEDVRAAVPAPEAMTAVVVGDLALLRPALAALPWGRMETRDETGAAVAP
jgi:zinc protease